MPYCRAEIANAAPVPLRRREAATRVLDRLHVDHAHRLRAHREDRRLEILEQERRELLLRLLGRAVVAVRVPHVADLGDEGLERDADRRNAVERQRAERRAVVREVARDRLVAARSHPRRCDDRVVVHLRLLRARTPTGGDDRAEVAVPMRDVVLPGELPCRLDRLGASRAEEDTVEIARRERRHLGGELDRSRVRVRPVRVEGQLAHLLQCRLADLLAERVADVDGEEPGERVEIALAVHVLEVAPVAADDHRHVLSRTAHPREVEPEVVAGSLLEVECSGVGHAAPCGCRAFRYSQITLPSPIAIATRKIALATTFTCGGTATRAMPQTKMGNVCVEPGVEVRDHEVVDREREAEQRGGEHRGRDQRQGDFAERRHLVGPEVHRGLLEVPVESDQSRLHRDDDEADDEHHMGDEDRPEAELEDPARVEEQRQERGAEHDLRRRHRQEDEDVRRRPAHEPMADDRKRDQRPEDRGDDCRQRCRSRSTSRRPTGSRGSRPSGSSCRT